VIKWAHGQEGSVGKLSEFAIRKGKDDSQLLLRYRPLMLSDIVTGYAQESK
jgi:hypothetical protein